MSPQATRWLQSPTNEIWLGSHVGQFVGQSARTLLQTVEEELVGSGTLAKTLTETLLGREPVFRKARHIEVHLQPSARSGGSADVLSGVVAQTRIHFEVSGLARGGIFAMEGTYTISVGVAGLQEALDQIVETLSGADGTTPPPSSAGVNRGSSEADRFVLAALADRYGDDLDDFMHTAGAVGEHRLEWSHLERQLSVTSLNSLPGHKGIGTQAYLVTLGHVNQTLKVGGHTLEGLLPFH